MLDVWGSGLVAFVFADSWHMNFWRAFGRCLRWAAFVVACMMLNYTIANALELSKQSSGYARGKDLISPYGFLVQTLLIVEVGGLWLWLRSREKKGK
jgi:hypothetical protein